MRLEYQMLCAMALDAIAGDPRWFPHPVRAIGWLAARLEAITRQLLPARIAGVVTALATVSVTGSVAWGLHLGAERIHPLAGDVVAVVLLWTTLAARSLAEHAQCVDQALARSDTEAARIQLGRMVSRDTGTLDESEVVRGAVESVAENTTDGVIAPLLYMCLLGPVGALGYKAISTLDSLFGYRNERYAEFGWASARMDDVAAYVPARLASVLMVVAAALLRMRSRAAVRILARDGRCHPSPNAGLAEATMAGALGVRLGGLSYHDGRPSPKPTLGDASEPLAREHIGKAVRVMALTSALAGASLLGLRLLLCHALGEAG